MSDWQQEPGNHIVAGVTFDSLAQHSLWHPHLCVAVPGILSVLLRHCGATDQHSSRHTDASVGLNAVHVVCW